MTALDALIGSEIRKAVEALGQRMPLNDALDLATRTADEAAKGWPGWTAIAHVKAALEKLVGPAPLTCPNCGAQTVCPLCGTNGRGK